VPIEQRREQLLDAALGIIDRDGYRAVSIDAIAKELDVTRPVVYHVYSGLEELLNALLERQEGRALEQLMSRISVPMDLSDVAGHIRRVVADLAAMVAADPVTWKPILLSSSGSPAAVRARIERDRELVRLRFRALIEAARPAPRAMDGVDADIAAHALLAIAEHFGRLLVEDPGAVDGGRLAATVAALFR
jgi:AcrR family transcriptional regulator